MIDIHNHILPGVDDGAKDMATAEGMLVNAANNGVDTIVCTPHNAQDGNEQTRQSFELLRNRAATLGIKLLTGAEYDFSYLDCNDYSFKTLAGSSFLLVDFRDAFPPVGVVQRIFFNLSRRGYQVLVAHPERSFNNLSYIEDLHRLGGYFQINAGSFLGKSGSRARSLARQMFKCGLCHYIASDDHDGTRMSHLRECTKYLEKLGGIKSAETLTRENPGRLLNNQPPKQVFSCKHSGFNLFRLFKASP